MAIRQCQGATSSIVMAHQNGRRDPKIGGKREVWVPWHPCDGGYSSRVRGVRHEAPTPVRAIRNTAIEGANAPDEQRAPIEQNGCAEDGISRQLRADWAPVGAPWSRAIARIDPAIRPTGVDGSILRGGEGIYLGRG